MSAFLGVFTGFYFIVSSSSDAGLRRRPGHDDEDTCAPAWLVRHAHWELNPRPGRRADLTCRG